MEISINGNSHLKTPIAKSPTRLQKYAPPALQLGQVTGNEAASCYTIPLLSPLILSPQPLEEREERRLVGGAGVGNGELQGTHDNNNTIMSALPSGDWQHPAVEAAFPDTSALFSFFQSQCAIVNRAQ
ncbi:Major viral transcription factor [Actinidia chinensis var. chinensis]|uniref:Major viral transcription factor n=1 Tax=Actinidia chinensis var. chinensis TaxID=1590841 RepID=A0A2R6P663_ACTCC|nr:Major viral transcription factor [Actinidia chinensis var. chinensis]